ncbi:hypothetical protein ASD24_05240 [Paenibacillus sp. Root52]|uniref:hypothetical protein n=1 Tax=Paenibacillus sp. Root52 TaxID=1736552 RepID=UPI0006F7E832|nr:hypothetical protein [Paenibacillus sp. Root52]KQY87269.1 hypothetical protein ASD24_05240 [Paenibacillus sp. Root52]
MRKSSRRFITWFLIVAAMMLFSGLLPITDGKAEAAQERFKSEFEFEFKFEEEASIVIPQVRVTKFYFDDGRVETELHEFPKQARAVSKDAQYLESARKKDDPALKQTFYPGCGWGFGTHVMNTEKGPLAFTIYCDSTTDKQPDAKGEKKSVSNHVIYKYDLERNLLSVLNQVQTFGESRPPFRMYYDFGGYTLQEDNGKINYEERNTRVYSLLSNKLLARIAGYPQEIGQTLRYSEYTKISNDPKVLAKIGNYVTHRNNNYIGETIILNSDGTRTKSKIPAELPDNVFYENKIGSITYVSYKNPKSENTMVGYRTSTSAAIKPLSRVDASSSIRFSKYERYVLIHQQTAKEKTLRIIDTKTAKVVSEIPDTGFAVYREVGDSILLFQAEKKDYYLHLPTGIVTRNMENSQLVQADTGGYTGDQSKLISMQAPPQMLVNGKPMRYAGQGPFLTKDNRWYVEVNDFAKAADATVSKTSSGLTINRGNYKMTVSKTDKTVLTWAGQTFVPLETLNEKLGMAGGFLNSLLGKGYEYKVLHVFSKDLKEADVIARPDLYEAIENDSGNYYSMENGKPAARPLSEANRYYYDGTNLIFKDGLLVNVASIYNAGGRTLRNIIFDINKLKHVIAVYGTPNATKTGGQMVRWYEVEGNVLVFESNTNLNSAYYIAR